MKLYIITISDVYEFEEFRHDPIVKLTRKEARKELAALKASAKETYKDQYNKCESKPDSFSLFPDGYLGESHYDAWISEVEVPDIILPGSKPKFRLDCIFGSEACDYADEHGLAAARRKVLSDDLFGAAHQYTFDTEHDRRLAEEILCDYDGWNNSFTEHKNLK